MILTTDIRRALLAFLEEEVIVASWGISKIQITDSTIKFKVNGLKYRGLVRIESNATAGYRISMGNRKQFCCMLDELVKCLDSEIEKVPNYTSEIYIWIIDETNM